MRKLENNEYSLDEIIEKQNTSKVVGKYKNDDVIIKNGKYGNYIEWGTNKKSLNGIEKELDEITIEDIIPLIENKININTSIVRNINSEISIRNGKYGHYIYYKTTKMTKPKFIKINGFKGNYNTCPKEQIEQYVSKN